MAIQFGAKEVETTTPVMAAEASPVSWWRDLAAHGDLKAQTEAGARRQTYLMEFIRVGGDPTPCRSAAGPVAPSWAPGVRVGGASDMPTQRRSVSVQAAEEELAALDQKLEDMREQMQALETTILTRDPETASETAAMLRFVSGMLAAGIKLDPDYLADVLEGCAEACGPTRVPTLSARN